MFKIDDEQIYGTICFLIMFAFIALACSCETIANAIF